ncbi:hypothetical protein [Acaryochloris thomasi]|uniref:hypothetical protein n=1 Tax=Acaryochloris thomasi TaxID=2929456 RepID=UPI0013140EFD|nr:hypothetical protein [Acaryochloris thomasi]
MQDKERTLQLIANLPSGQQALSQALRQLAGSFRFDVIMTQLDKIFPTSSCL